MIANKIRSNATIVIITSIVLERPGGFNTISYCAHSSTKRLECHFHLLADGLFMLLA